jgi:hypothetical protein
MTIEITMETPPADPVSASPEPPRPPVSRDDELEFLDWRLELL